MPSTMEALKPPIPTLPLPTAIPAASSVPVPKTLPHLKELHAHLLRHSHPISTLLSLSLSPFTPLPATSALSHAASALAALSPSPRQANRVFLSALRAAGPGPSPARVLAAYACLRRAGVPPDRFALPAVLRAAARSGGGAAAAAKDAHGIAVRLGFEEDVVVRTALVKAYAALGDVDDARKVFERMKQRDLVAWGVMLDCYCQVGKYKEALLLFDEMKSSGIEPDQVILATVLSASGRTRNLRSGKAVHSYILERNLRIDAHLGSALINMYANCGDMEMADKLYHGILRKQLVASTAMVFGYAKNGRIDTARSIFDEMPEKDLVSWSAMISGYVESDQPNEALNLFREMQQCGVRPDEISMLSVISACANLGALDQAKWIYMFVEKNGLCEILSVCNALIDMFSKCGSLSLALKIFDEMPRRNIITWTSMITAFAMHGDGRSALALFDQMKGEGIEPNGVTFVGLLYACSHAGLVEEGRSLFKSMVQEHRIEPKHEHYGCMVDLLGRAKLLQEAVELIESMHLRPNVIVWGSLLAACRLQGDLKLGKFAAKKLLELDPDHDGAYVLLSNIYAKSGNWDSVRELRGAMKLRGLSKEKGCSWMELNGRVHGFAMGDETHPENDKIHMKLNEVVRELETHGYAPDDSRVLVDLDEEDKREAILLHSEKLALSFGLINSKRGSCIRITKNIRVCQDCHSFMKLVSQVYEREIVLRDRTRFHHVRNGICSCRDFW